jgi:hypothetical protein
VNALFLAIQHVEHIQAEAPSSIADTFARELLDTQRRLELALADVRKLVHERDWAEESLRRTQALANERIWPLAARCDGPRCPSAVAVDPLPEEADLAAALWALKWRIVDGKHLCPRCQR